MHILFTDETNLPQRDAKTKFFAYGGLIVPLKNLAGLHDEIAQVRANAGYLPTDELKFDTRARPQQVTIEKAKVAKRRVIEICAEQGCKFIVCVVLHAIARGKSVDELIEFGANVVVEKFHRFLVINDSHGVVAMDRFSSRGEYKVMADRFSGGLLYQDGNKTKRVPLTRIHLFTSTCSNASHASSAMDISLGGFRFCINAGAPKPEPAKAIMRNVANLLWCERRGEELMALERGLVFRPYVVRVPKYQAEYDALLEGINELLD
jgi:hypothetical protein